MRDIITNKVMDIVRKYSDVHEITLNMKLQGVEENSLDMNSLQIVSIIVDIEDEFGIVVDFDKYFDCIEDIITEVVELIEIKENGIL